MPTIDQIREQAELDMIPLADTRIRCLTVLPGTREVLLGCDESMLRVDIDARSTHPIELTLREQWGDAISPAELVGLPERRFLCATFDSAFIVELKSDKTVKRRKVSLRSRISNAGSIALAADQSGQVFMATASDYLIRVAAEGPSPYVREKGDNRFWAVAVSPDGAKVANGRSNGTIELRDPNTLEVQQTLSGLETTCLSMAFSPDGRYLVAGDDYTHLFVWDLENDKSFRLEGLGKVVRLAWLGDSSGFYAVGLTRHVGVFTMAELEYSRNTLWPEGFDTRYFTDAALIDDRTLAVAVEDHGLLLARF